MNCWLGERVGERVAKRFSEKLSKSDSEIRLSKETRLKCSMFGEAGAAEVVSI